MRQFAKLFETKQGQFLVTLDAEDDDGLFPMVFRTNHEKCLPEVTNLYESEHARLEKFNVIDQAQAEEAAAAMARMVDNFFKG